jgi:tetratricopeptide (TPR) repeat protein
LFAVGQRSAAYHEGDRRGTFYAQSWALTHMLLSGSGDDLGRLERCLVAAREGEPFSHEFARVFGDELALRDQLHDYVDRPRYSVREWRLSRRLDGPPLRVRDRVPAAEVLATLGNSLLAREQPDRALAEEHLRGALARDPGNPDACAGMGWLLLQRGRREEAPAWFERVLERDPISVPAVRLLASQLLFDASNRTGRAAREAGATFVRRALARASVVAPGEPEIEALYARSWVVGYGDDPEPGYLRAKRAVERLPGRFDVRLDLLALAALTGRAEEARALDERYFRTATRTELHQAARRALLAGEVRAVNARLLAGDAEGAERLMREARDRVGDDPQLASEADQFLRQMGEARASRHEVRRENSAIGEYNDGALAANQKRYAEAAAAFRRAAAASGRTPFRTRALRMVVRMDQRARGERAMELARQGQTAEARAIFAAMDRASMTEEDRRWLDRSLAMLRKARRR